MSKENEIRSHFEEVYNNCGYLRISQDERYDISPETVQDVCRIINNAPKLQWPAWMDLYEKGKNNDTVMYFVINHNMTPPAIRQSAVDDVVQKVKDGKGKPTKMQIKTLLCALRHNLQPHTEADIVKAIPNEIFASFAQYSYEASVQDKSALYQKPNPCPYTTSIIGLLCDRALSFPLPKEINNWRCSPFRFIKNNEVAESTLIHPKCNNVVRNAIMNNCYLGFDTRMRAMEEGDLNDILNASDEMKYRIYDIVCDSFFVPDIEKLPPDAPEVRAKAKATIFLINKMMAGLWTEAMQIDLINRLNNADKGKVKNTVRNAIFQYTRSQAVLEMAKQVQASSDVYTAYQNKHMKPQTLADYVNNIFKKIGPNTTISLSANKLNVVRHALSQVQLSDKVYEAIISQEKLTSSLSQAMVHSQYTPAKYIEAMAEKMKGEIKPAEYENTLTSLISAKSLLANDVYLDAKTHLVLKEHIAPHLVNEIMDILKSLDCYKVAKFGSIYTPVSIGSIDSEYHKFKRLAETFSHIPTSTFKKIKADISAITPANINNARLEGSQEALNDIFHIGEKIMNMNNYFEFSGIFSETIERAATYIVENWVDQTIEDPVAFYSNLDATYRTYSYYCEELLDRKERENAIKEIVENENEIGE